MKTPKILLNIFTVINTLYLCGIIYFGFYMGQYASDYPHEISYMLEMYVFFGYCAILVINYALFGKITLWNDKDKND